ncbi:MAG: ABC transporter ATP-binding protein [Thiohalomonadales bacterium]
MSTILEVKNLKKNYGSIIAVDNISFSLDEGVCLGLLGPNGAGKTTTIEIIEGITQKTSGEVSYFGENIGSKFKQQSGIQFQSTALQDFLTVKETIEQFSRLYDHTMDIDTLVELCALREFLNRDTKKLSGGQRQRLLLALALVNDPKIIFLDEPTTGLDPQARRNFWSLIDMVKAKNKAIVLTTHYMEEAAILCDELIIMDKGRIVAKGMPNELLQKHFDDVILQIPKIDFMQKANSVDIAYIEHNEMVVFHTQDVSETLRLLTSSNVDLRRLEIRSRNLEDLFLELTGKDLGC